MVKNVTESHSTERVLSVMHPIVSEWFKNKFGEVTEAQAMAVPLIHARESVLVSSPTGSGKTLTAFLSILNELILKAGKGELEDRIYAVYVSPLKALANDINENLLKPLAEIDELFRAKGLEPPDIKVAVRTGDTLQSERQKQARSPPHIFITTPESLSLILTTPVFSKKFEGVDYVIVDEVHEICDSKRGVALSVSLERLQACCKGELTRIGLSATVAPLDQVAEYLVGLKDGEPRAVNVVEVFRQRDLDLKVLCPTKDMNSLSFEVVNSKMYDMLKEMILQHKTTLVFTNTRSGAESVVYKLKERGIENIGTHHGSLSRETRLEVEDSLRSGKLQVVVSSTSLELGIDIGYIDLVVQIGSPKSVAKGLQRIGRAGHRYGGTSKGRIVVFEMDDLVECAVLCRAAHRKMIDRVTIPENSLDVLAQTLVGMSIERKWNVQDAFKLIRRSWCYRKLTFAQFDNVLRYLGGKDEFEGIYSKIWYDEKEQVFGRKHGSRMIFYLNQGTIPEEADYTVFSERGAHIGSLSEKFVERLSSGDIFVLGGRSYEFIKSKGTKVFVKSASGRKPTVPSWTGEMLPRSFDLSLLIAEFRAEMKQRIGEIPDKKIQQWLMKEFDVDEGSAVTIINYFREQNAVATIPTNENPLVEGYVDQSGNRSAIFHWPFGRRVNDALSRAYASVLSDKLKTNVTVSVTDDSFMLTSSKNFRLDDLRGMLRSEDLERVLRNAVKDSELFNQRFRHTATRAFMILRNYKGRELSVARQQLRSTRLLDALHGVEGFPVMLETYEEILTDVMDLENATEVLRSFERGDREVSYLAFTNVPSPFAHNVILVGVSDIVLMEDRSMLLRELHRKVLARVMGDEAISEYQFETKQVEDYYASKFPRIASKDDMLTALRKAGPMNLFREKGENIFSHSSIPFEALRSWSGELLKEGKVRSVWISEDMYVTTEDYPLYNCLHRRQVSLNPGEKAVLEAIASAPKTQSELATAHRLSREDMRDMIRHLETANEIYRSDIRGEAFLYSRADLECRPRMELAKEAVGRYLSYHAPATLEDAAYEVGISEPETDEALRELISEEAVIAGRFVVGEQQQYMLAKDYLQLKSKDGGPVFDRETIRAYTEFKQFSKVSDVRKLFDKFGEAGMIYDISQRVERFNMQDFGELRKKGEILLGRFVRGRLRYVLADDAPYYLGVYRHERLTKYEDAILQALRKIGKGTYQDIASAAGFPPDIMREYFDSLDRKGFLLRLWDEAESWTSRNVYVPCDIDPILENPHERVVERYLRGFGPATVIQVAAYLDTDYDFALSLLRKVGAKSITVGLERTEMFLLPDEMAGLESVPAPEDTLRILSLYDPYLGDKWTELTSRYGEGWFFPLVKAGRIVGMIELWQLAGSVEIRDVQLDDPELLGALIESADRMMPFYGSMGIEILRIRSAFGIDAGQLDDGVKKEFLSRGYAESNGFLVKGRVVAESFELSDLLGVVFSLQNIEESSKLQDMDEVLTRLGGLHSNAEALLRVVKFEKLQKMHKRGLVVRGHLIPDRVGYCRPEDASLYQAARQTDLSADEKLIMRIVKDQQPVKRDRLLDLSPLGRQDTIDAIKSLYSSSRLYLDVGLSYVGVRRRKVKAETAWQIVVKRLFEDYGVIAAESLSGLLGHEIPMRQIRRTLRRLEDDGYLVKGYLLLGSGQLYWATKEAFASLGKIQYGAKVILSPEDNLTQYLRAGFRGILPETGRHMVFRGPTLVGSFTGRIKGGKLEVHDLIGESECEEIIEDYARTLGLALMERDEGRIPDWEIMDFYQRTHPGVNEK
jgi:ATP-dependent Lhr-like helicase